MNNTIIFPHCPKTGGTTLKERYRTKNADFAVTDLGDQVDTQTKVIFGHTAHIGGYEKLINNLVYVTCLRDPIERMMSMYNFYKTQLHYMNPDVGDIDFYLWFINKDVIRPMNVTKQYEYYLYQHIDHTDWFDQGILANPSSVNDMFSNTVLKWDVDKDVSSVDTELLQKRVINKNKIERQNMNVTWENVMQQFDHVLFQDQNIVKEFDKLLDDYDLELTPWREMRVTNETKYDLHKHNLQYTYFTDLDDDLQYLVRLDLQNDIEFYTRCADRWKH